MTDGLRDPDLPSGAVVEVLDDDTAVRNDGQRLNPAARNPWYVLATVAGDPAPTHPLSIDKDIAARNRRYWNGWACTTMDDTTRAALAKRMELPVAELAPLDEHELSQVREAFLSRLGEEFTESIVDGAIDFRLTHFATLVCNGFIFPRLFMLSEATISGASFFQGAIFLRSAQFVGANFANLSSFEGSAFDAGAIFEDCDFHRFCNFQGCYFSHNASFSRAKFSQASFSKADFISSYFTDFSDASFRNNAMFDGAKFGLSANFLGSRVQGDCVFIQSEFRGSAGFSKAIFGRLANFERAEFRGNNDFSDGHFCGATSFENAHFRESIPKFYQCRLHQDTTFTIHPKYWPEIKAQNAKVSKPAYSRLRQFMLELEKPDDAHFFFRQEMRCKEFEEDHWWNWVPITLFRWLSNYGYSLARPMLWLALVWLIPSIWYFRTGVFFDTAVAEPGCYAGWGVSAPGCAAETFGAAAQAMGFSFANIFPFGLTLLHFGREFVQELPLGLQFLAGAQTVLGFLLLFLLGLGLRNRFRLR